MTNILACPGCEDLKPLLPVARHFGGQGPFSIIYVCFGCAIRLISPDAFSSQVGLWFRMEANISDYPLMYLFPQRYQADVATQQGVFMNAIEPKEVTAFLKATVKENEGSDVPAQRALAERAATYLQAHNDLATSRLRIKSIRLDIDKKHVELERIETAATTLRSKSAQLIGSHDEIRRKRAGAALNEAMRNNEAAVLVHDRNLANEIDDLSAVLQEADARKTAESKALDSLQGQLREQRRLAFDARQRITLGLLMLLESRTAIALADLALVFKLSGERGNVIGSDIGPDPDAYEAMYDSVRNELADLLEN